MIPSWLMSKNSDNCAELKINVNPTPIMRSRAEHETVHPLNISNSVSIKYIK